MVTSTALLIAAIKKLHVDKTLSVYHLDFVMTLVGLCVSACGYTALSRHSIIHLDEPRDDDDDDRSVEAGASKSKKEQQEWFTSLRDWMPWGLRMVLMLSSHVLLLYVIWVAARPDWYEDASCPALCLSQRSAVGGAGLYNMVLNYFFIISTDIFSILQGMSRVNTWWALRLRPKLVDGRSLPSYHSSQDQHTFGGQDSEGNQMRSETQIQKKLRWILPRLLKGTKHIFAWLWILRASQFVTLVEVIIWTGLYYKWSFESITWGHESMEEEELEAEGAWGFGQIVPVFLLTLLVLQFFNSLWGKSVRPLVQKHTYILLQNGDGCKRTTSYQGNLLTLFS